MQEKIRLVSSRIYLELSDFPWKDIKMILLSGFTDLRMPSGVAIYDFIFSTNVEILPSILSDSLVHPKRDNENYRYFGLLILIQLDTVISFEKTVRISALFVSSRPT